ncbi:hypothetical protein [Phytohabitans rumicis]|uniref:hypothetical protein n=1 Tax=Phytohabitans rumicis TaxID=1076125 RepID=UPI0031E658CC
MSVTIDVAPSTAGRPVTAKTKLHVITANVVLLRPPTLSALKAMLWADVLTKATRQIRPATITYRAHVDVDTLGFWEFLDRVAGDRHYPGLDSADLAALYHRYRRQPWQPPHKRLISYAQAVAFGWLHPAGRRTVDLFTRYARLLRLAGFDALPDAAGSAAAAGNGTATTLAHAYGGALPRHLTRTVLDLAPAIDRQEPAVILHDVRRTGDYKRLERTLRGWVPALSRLALRRLHDDMPGGGDSASLSDLERVVESARQALGDQATQLGVRLYFLAVLGRDEPHRFHPGLLHRWIGRADRLLCRIAGGGDVTAALRRFARQGYVSPYELTTDLLGHRPMPRKDIVRSVYA